LPRINAAGRIASSDDAVELLMTDDMEEARALARKLDEYNRRRQALEKTIFQDIVTEIEQRGDVDQISSLVFASADWHPGVIGIVASRLVERFCRPTMLISLKNGVGKGSGRTVADFNIYQGLRRCKALLQAYGGHQFAAGIVIREDDVAAFKQLFDEVIRQQTDITKLVSQTIIDAQCRLKDINHNLLNQISMMAPFGSKNPEPVMCVRNVNVTSPSVVGKNNLRIRVHEGDTSCDSIWFSKGQFRNSFAGPLFDIAFTPQINDWRGSGNIQLNMKDIAVPDGV
jgi:single-stranded-DNA-specific exonuclease